MTQLKAQDRLGLFPTTLVGTVVVIALGLSASGGTNAEVRGHCQGEVVTIEGTSGDDRIRGTRAADVIDARAGDDVVRGGAGADRVCARSGRDQVLAQAGDDRVTGGKHRDRLFGGPGDDRLRGRERADLVTGERGSDDLCVGGSPAKDGLGRGDSADTRSCERIRSAFRYGSFDFSDGKITRDRT